MKNIFEKFRAMAPFKKLIIAMVIFFILFSYFASMRYYSGIYGDPDYGTFEQSIYTTLKHGMPQYNTFEERSHFRYRNPDMPRTELLENLKAMDGRTHLGVHTSFIFFLTLPFYAIYNDLVTLIILQVLAITLGAWAVFLIGREVVDERIGLLFGLLYLLNFPIHGISYDSFHEFGFVIAPILFSFYFLLKRKFIPFWIMILIAVSCKEDIPILCAAYGLFAIYWGWRQTKDGKWEGSFLKNPVTLNGAALFLFSCVYFYLALFVIIPHFRGVDYHFFGERYADLGSSFKEVVVTLLTRPDVVLKNLFQYPKFTFFVEMVAPLALMSFFCFPAFLVSVPNLVVNTLSSFSVMYNTGSRYSTPIIPFIFISAILGFSNILAGAKSDEDRQKRYKNWMKAAFFITIAGALFFNPSPFRAGWKVPKIKPHRKVTWKMIDKVPKNASLATQVDLFLFTCRRLKGYVGYREGVDYILADIGKGGEINFDEAAGEVKVKYPHRKSENDRPSEFDMDPGDIDKGLEALPREEKIKKINEVEENRKHLYENRWFINGADWDIIIPQLLREGKYKIDSQEDGVVLLKRV